MTVSALWQSPIVRFCAVLCDGSCTSTPSGFVTTHFDNDHRAKKYKLIRCIYIFIRFYSHEHNSSIVYVFIGSQYITYSTLV